MPTRRRGNNEGSIYRRKADGRWCARVIQPDGSRKHFYGRTRAEVADRLNDALSTTKIGITIPGERKTVEEFLNQWLDGVKFTLRPKTWSRYEQFVRTHVVPHLGRYQLGKLQPAQIQALYGKLVRGGLSPTTVHHIHATLHRAFEQAVKWGELGRNPVKLVDAPRMRHIEMKTFSPEDANRFLAAIAHNPWRALYVLAMTSGMRQGELLALRWKHVDLKEGVLAVMGTLQRGPDGLTIEEPKTHRSRRQVVVTQLALDALIRHRGLQDVARERAGSMWNENDLVFPNRIGNPIESDNVRDEFYRVLAESECPRIRFHDLRHTAATFMLKQGVHPKVASEMLGHSTIAITLDLYSHVSSTMQAEAAAAVDRLFADSGEGEVEAAVSSAD